MQTASLTEWLNSPETKALVTYLKFRQAAPTAEFLQGLPVNPIAQGKTAGLNEIERLLTEPAEKIIEAFTNASRKLNEQHRRP